MTIPTHGFPTPEQAAMSGFPAQHCRVVTSRVSGRDAYVLLDTGPAGHPYLYGVACGLRDGRWYEGSSGNGPGWTATDLQGTLGMWTMWGEALSGADSVRLEFDGESSEHPVVNGCYLAVWFNRPFEI